jgi:SAM-dependent methyltransferase|tara:strand:+ start:365 stop:1573 length:1209 start_codon:yes stop_codon:yes gene_type:complete
MTTYKERISCESCGHTEFDVIFDFGKIPLAGSFPKEPDAQINTYPLKIIKCKHCGLVQTNTLIPPNTLFKDYRYISSVGMQDHFNDFADWLVRTQKLTGMSNVLEFGCNDGPLLEALKYRGIHNTLGVDPATNIVELGRKKSLNILNDFFDYNLARNKEWGNKFDLILASNTFAHIEDINSVIKGVHYSLKPKGRFIFEVQYLVDLVDKFQFDFMYHEHLFYYTVTSLKPLLSKYGLKIIDVKSVPIHSGSIRVVATKDTSEFKEEIVDGFMEIEKDYKDLSEFSSKISLALNDLSSQLGLIKEMDKVVAGYGASGRANVVTSTMNWDTNDLMYIVDESPERYDRFTSNGKIPIFNPEILKVHPPDYILILAWNFADMIIEKTKHLGIPYIVPFPEVKFIKP